MNVNDRDEDGGMGNGSHWNIAEMIILEEETLDGADCDSCEELIGMVRAHETKTGDRKHQSSYRGEDGGEVL